MEEMLRRMRVLRKLKLNQLKQKRIQIKYGVSESWKMGTAHLAKLDTYVAPPSTAESDPHISVVSSVSETFVKDSEGLKTSGITVGSVSEDGSGPVNDFQTKIGRSERLGVPVQFSEQEKRNSRADRKGFIFMVKLFSCLILHPAQMDQKHLSNEELKIKARGERFGHVLPSTGADQEAKEKARLARFAPSKTDSGRRNKKNKGNRSDFTWTIQVFKFTFEFFTRGKRGIEDRENQTEDSKKLKQKQCVRMQPKMGHSVMHSLYIRQSQSWQLMGIFIMKGNNLSSEAIEQALVGHLSRPVIDLEFNAIASNLLASRADGGKICIWNLAAPAQPSHFLCLLMYVPVFAQVEEWTVLCDMLALKLMAAGNTLAATLWYICAGNIDKTDLMEKTIVLALATGQKPFSASLCKLVEKYAEILAIQGLLTAAMEYLKLLGSDELSPELAILKDRIAVSAEPGMCLGDGCVFDLRVKATFMRTKVVCTRILLHHKLSAFFSSIWNILHMHLLPRINLKHRLPTFLSQADLLMFPRMLLLFRHIHMAMGVHGRLAMGAATSNVNRAVPWGALVLSSMCSPIFRSIEHGQCVRCCIDSS
ncbi:protein transport protein SEC31-like isoform 1 [Corchorus olitorius]|uniref:Protein transport protein SEC31-like isoform 1 n=1 Tax=Corchorus olitorius TaxID=93759 RepID=A0A1R3KXJ9_9ROSI|nr:protein transport protein SEC31-like isoform 1 [Corchorus olitorius]